MVELLTNLNSGIEVVEGDANTNLGRGRGKFILGLVEFKKRNL